MTRCSTALLPSVAALALMACGGSQSPTAPLQTPSMPSFTVGDATNNTPVVGTVKVCKLGNVSGQFTLSRIAEGASTGTLASSPYTVASGDCRVIAEDNGGSGIGSFVTITEDPATYLTGISAVLIGAAGVPSSIAFSNGGAVFVNSFHGYVITFTNNQPTSSGCTLTLGYWKNHASKWVGISPTASFYSSGKTYIQVLNTPPLGDAYYILAHQFIAAQLNVNAGASTTSAVDDALAGAASYFSGSTTPSRDQLIAWANTLDQYNNGLIGPGHC